MFCYRPNNVVVSTTTLHEHELNVEPYLAYEVKEIAAMVDHGKTVNNANLESLYYEGTENCSCDVPIDGRRGVDINDVFNYAAERGEKIRKSKVRKVDINPSKS